VSNIASRDGNTRQHKREIEKKQTICEGIVFRRDCVVERRGTLSVLAAAALDALAAGSEAKRADREDTRPPRGASTRGAPKPNTAGRTHAIRKMERTEIISLCVILR
jgi:hypothetical protein